MELSVGCLDLSFGFLDLSFGCLELTLGANPDFEHSMTVALVPRICAWHRVRGIANQLGTCATFPIVQILNNFKNSSRLDHGLRFLFWAAPVTKKN